VSRFEALRRRLRLRTRLRNAREAVHQLSPLFSYGFWGKGHRRVLTNVTFYATNLCDSRCIHCGFWQQRPVLHLSPEVFQRVHDSPATDIDTVFGFEGGEFPLHPQADEILEIFRGRKIELYANGLKPELTKALVRKHSIPHLILSLDGRKETYRKIRGVDGFDRVTALAAEMARETLVSISYTLSPWNDLDDFQFVRQFCQRHGITFGLNILHNATFFHPDFDYSEQALSPEEFQMQPIPFAAEEHFQGDHPVKLDYFLGYNEWLRGNLHVPCTSIFHRIVVFANGDIPLCQKGDFGILGNLYEQSLEEIWWSRETLARQKRRIRCNACWISFHRYDDLFMYRAMKTLLPERWIRFWMKHAKGRAPS